MADYFVDTSALAKRYIGEVGSTWLRTLVDPASGARVFIARITSVELIAAVTRRERGGTLSPTDAVLARMAFHSDLLGEYQVVEITERLISTAIALAQRHALRGYDAVQLAAALEVNTLLTASRLPTLTVLSSDAELNAAAAAESLATDDPAAHP